MGVQRRRVTMVSLAVLVGAVVVVTALIVGRRPAAPAAATEHPQRSPASPTSASIGSFSQDRQPSSAAAASAGSTASASVVSITTVGDIGLGNTPDLPASPAIYLAPVHSALAAPIVFGNLEGTLTSATSSKCDSASPKPTSAGSAAPTSPAATAKRFPVSSPTPSTTVSPTSTTGTSVAPKPKPPTCYAFHMPPSYASVLRSAGFTVLNSANNHSHDFGRRGAVDTTAALGAADITQTGLPGQISVVSASGLRIAFVGFAPYADTNNMLDTAAARRLIAAAKRNVDLVVVYMHAGAEGSAATHVTGREEHYLSEDRGNPQAFAHAAIDAGADLVLASGPHVLRGLQYYRGHLIAYSLGDFAGYHNFATTGVLALSGILRVGLDRDGHPTAARFTSIVLDASGRPAIDPRGRAAALVNQLSVADFGASAAVIGASGDISSTG